MTKAEQEWSLIEALVYCKGKRLTKKSCAGCPYAGAGCAIDATIAKLKAQEPRVMMLEEVHSCENAMWIELFGGKGFYAFVLDRMKNGILEISTRAAYLRYYSKDYNVKWRCWTSRPTDTQREATPWEHEK